MAELLGLTEIIYIKIYVHKDWYKKPRPVKVIWKREDRPYFVPTSSHVKKKSLYYFSLYSQAFYIAVKWELGVPQAMDSEAEPLTLWDMIR